MQSLESQLTELPALNAVTVPDLWQQQAVAALREGRDRIVEPQPALAPHDNVQVQGQGRAVLDGLLGAFGQLEIEPGAQDIDVLGGLDECRTDFKRPQGRAGAGGRARRRQSARR